LKHNDLILTLQGSIAMALASILFAGGNNEDVVMLDGKQVTVKEAADGNAVFLGEVSMREYLADHPEAAVVILGDEGSKDDSFAMEMGTIYYAGYSDGKRHFMKRDKQGEFKGMRRYALRVEIKRLEWLGVRILYFVGDAL